MFGITKADKLKNKCEKNFKKNCKQRVKKLISLFKETVDGKYCCNGIQLNNQEAEYMIPIFEKAGYKVTKETEYLSYSTYKISWEGEQKE